MKMFGRKTQKHHIIDVINYEGPQDVLVWKHPNEDFNTRSQLIVHESQEAILFRNGQALDVFPAGRYTLETQNLPLLRRMISLPTGGVTPFHCEIYYITKNVSMGIEWGTDSPIEMLDVVENIPISVTAYGDYSLRVNDGRKLLVKLAGTVHQYTQKEIQRYFNEILAMHIRDCVANIMVDKGIGGARVNTQLIALANGIQSQLTEVFAEYGLAVNHFAVSNVSVHGLEDIHGIRKNVKLDTIAETGKAGVERIKIGVDAERIQSTGKAKNTVMLEQGMVEAQINQTKGITETQKMALGVAEKLASNTGPTVSNAGAVPFSNGMMGATGSVHISSPAGNSTDIVKTVFGEKNRIENEARAARRERLVELKEWFEEGLITENEYIEKRKAIIDNL